MIYDQVLYTVRAHPKWQTELTCELSLEHRQAWLQKLQLTLLKPSSDPVIRFKPQPLDAENKEILHQWSIYWKIREGDSRSIMAHPSPAEWVITVGLLDNSMQTIIKMFQEGTDFSLAETVILNRVSNFNLKVIFKKD